ncbi:hypothetical protein RB6441 [Rhodopirellula baltica SH 1]|uniref:Uncharacterized protein n=1 Tax=Rhodopirellula baltica (strain DSM 10527 / NCIMB 13988 / SH1) TaxID=243090 RepID=Q7UQA1_RHOBA|nr:hypothetical protein RB6441 [Rhodopirellula baltica SH 1]
MCWLFSSEAASGRKSLNKRHSGGDAISPRRAFSLATGSVLGNRFSASLFRLLGEPALARSPPGRARRFFGAAIPSSRLTR